jgi:GT2 family glycosyltransferase
MKILIGVICLENIKAKTVATIVSIIKRHPEAQLLIKQGSLLHKNREEVALASITGNYDYLFFIDSDMCFSSMVLDRFIEADKEIIGANYNMRHLPLCSTMKMEDENGNLTAREGIISKEPFIVHALGTGCMLIKVSALKKILRPWFWYGEPGKQVGEDIHFCRQAKKAGIDIWCEPNVEVNHIGEYLY